MEAVQIARTSATVPVRSCRSPERVQRPTLSPFPATLRTLRGEAFQNWRAATTPGLNREAELLRLSFGPSQVHVTIPRRVVFAGR